MQRIGFSAKQKIGLGVADIMREKIINEFVLSADTVARLDVLVAELTRWQKIKNLVGPATLEHVWSRHIADSLQLHALAPEAKSWLDLGSGAGFPGLVLAILGIEHGFHVTLVEANTRKCAFLRHVTRLTGAAATIHAERLEAVLPALPGRIDILTARALAPLDQLLSWTAPLFQQGTIALFPKGREVAVELAVAGKNWQMDYEILPSQIDQESSILRITALSQNTPQGYQPLKL